MRILAHLFVVALLVTAGALFALPEQAAGAPEAQAAQTSPPVLGVPSGYKYDSRGRRDPFTNPVPKPASAEPESVAVPTVRPPGLKGVLIGEIQIPGIVTSKEKSMNLAVIIGPGNRTYFAVPGDELYDSVVKEITVDSVIFVMKPPPGSEGKPSPPREVVKKTSPVSGGR